VIIWYIFPVLYLEKSGNPAADTPMLCAWLFLEPRLGQQFSRFLVEGVTVGVAVGVAVGVTGEKLLQGRLLVHGADLLASPAAIFGRQAPKPDVAFFPHGSLKTPAMAR
jgi:hypothetical protein